MSREWKHEDTVMYGVCPRSHMVVCGHDFYVESHSDECRRETHSHKGWRVRCRDLGIDEPLKATNAEEARKLARPIIADYLRKVADEVLASGEPDKTGA